MRGLVKARDLGKTRTEADTYALDLLRDPERTGLQASTSLRRRAQELIYTDPTLTAATVEAAARASCGAD